MASFLVRMFELPLTGTDFFSDDETSHPRGQHQPPRRGRHHHRLRGRPFCPKAHVLRDQMASFLARAAGLTVGGGRDYFNDDDGNSHEPNIDRTPRPASPPAARPRPTARRQTVTRQQMAAFLHRILARGHAAVYPAAD